MEGVASPVAPLATGLVTGFLKEAFPPFFWLVVEDTLPEGEVFRLVSRCLRKHLFSVCPVFLQYGHTTVGLATAAA